MSAQYRVLVYGPPRNIDGDDACLMDATVLATDTFDALRAVLGKIV